MKKIVVVGGGAAGIIAALRCSAEGHDVVLLEKNEKLGKKLFITGKGRCNLTNACDVSDLFSNVVSNARFLYSAFYNFSNQDTIAFFEDLGLRTKEERGGRVFPMSDKSSDVIRVLSGECRRRGVRVCLNTEVAGLLTESGADREDCERSVSQRRRTDFGRCRYTSYRRGLLSFHRVHRGRIPHGGECGTCDPSGPGRADGNPCERGYGLPSAGTYAEKLLFVYNRG